MQQHAGAQQAIKETPTDPVRRENVSMTDNVPHILHASTTTVVIHVSQEHVEPVLTAGYRTTDLSVHVLKAIEVILLPLVREKSLLVVVTANQHLLRLET